MKAIFTSFLVLVTGLALQAQTTTVTAKQTGEITSDAAPAGKANANDEIRYKVEVQNTGANQANGVNFNAVPDARTTFQGGSFRSSPVAFPDGPYACVGNVGITVPDGASDLLANDFDDNIAGLSLTAGTFATTQGGSITINANGSFSYTPPRGFEGTDTYQYTLNDGNAESGVPSTDQSTVTINVNEVIWFVNNNASACAANCGPLSTPYTSLAAFNTDNNGTGSNPADDDFIFIYESATSYGSGIVLRNGQKLIGQDATVSLAAATGLTLPPFSNPLPATNSGNGTLATIVNAAGSGITLAQNNTVRGLNVVNTTVSDITGSNFGTLTLSEVTLSGTGKALDLNTGTLAATFASITSTSSTTQGLLLTSVAGTLNIGSTTVSGSTNQGISISSSSVAVSFGNTSVTTTGGTGVLLQSNTGGLTFADLDITPNANQRALHATENSGLITTSTGTISNSGAVAIEITKTTGTTPLSVSLTSVSASGAANGIVVTNASGSFTITGSGTTNGSGGTIQNITNRGAGFTNAANVTLKNIVFNNANTTDAGSGCGSTDNSGCNGAIHLNGMTTALLDNVDITTVAQQGINVRETSGFQLLNSTIIANGGEVEESCLYAQNLFGTASISNSTFSFPGDRAANFYIVNKTLNMTVSGSTFADTQTSATGADGLEFNSLGNSITDVDITNCTFLRCKTNGVQFLTESTSQGTVDISGCSVDPGAGVGNGFDIASNGTSVLRYNIFNNTSVKARAGIMINLFAQGNSNMQGAVTGNTISSLSGAGTGVRAVSNVNGTHRTKIQNNTISNIAQDSGISIESESGTGRIDATISGNSVTILNTAAFNIQVAAGASSSTFTNKTCANVSSNTVSPSPIPGGAAIAANFHARAATASHELLLQGSSPISTYWNSKSNLPVSPTSTVVTTGSGVFTYNATCLLPVYP